MTVGLFSISQSPSAKPFLFFAFPNFSLCSSYGNKSLAPKSALQDPVTGESLQTTLRDQHPSHILDSLISASRIKTRSEITFSNINARYLRLMSSEEEDLVLVGRGFHSSFRELINLQVRNSLLMMMLAVQVKMLPLLRGLERVQWNTK